MSLHHIRYGHVYGSCTSCVFVIIAGQLHQHIVSDSWSLRKTLETLKILRKEIVIRLFFVFNQIYCIQITPYYVFIQSVSSTVENGRLQICNEFLNY